jgi:hypothetical protein
VGNTYKAQQRAFTREYFCKFEASDLRQGVLGDVTEDDALREGYSSIAAFEDAWVKIHEEPYDLTQKVWELDFRVVEVPPPYDRILEIVPKGTEENLVDLEYMLTKYPQLEAIINPVKEHTRSEAYDVLFERPKEEIDEKELNLMQDIEQASERINMSTPGFPDPDEVADDEAKIGILIGYKDPEPATPPVTPAELEKVEPMTLEEARAGEELCFARILELQNIISDAKTELLKVQKDLGTFQYYQKKSNIRKRTQIKRSYV